MASREIDVRRLRASAHPRVSAASRRPATRLTAALVCCLLVLPIIGTRTADAQIARNDAHQALDTDPFGVRLENFDLRTSDEKSAARALHDRREMRLGDRSHLAGTEQLMLAARESLAAANPNLRLTDSRETGAPEIVGISYGNMDRLTAPAEAPNESIARSFVETNSWLYGLSAEQIASLETDADYTNPAGNISWVRLKQSINGLPVFRGTLTVALTPRGEVMRTMGQLAAALSSEVPLPSPTLSAAEAIAAGAGILDMKIDADDLVAIEKSEDGFSATFERGPFSLETDAHLVYFPLGPGAVELAWSMTLWGEVDAYYMLVSADDGLLLFNKNITEHQTQPATYEVYRNVTSSIDTADSPAPLSPGPIDPNAGTQGTLLTRANVPLIGNEGALSFNINGWITDGANGTNGHTDGNNVEAGLDIVAPDGVDAPLAGVGRVFSSSWNPPPGIPGPGDAPSVPAARNGAVIQMFYITNRYHDALYQVGFTEPALNFQDNNFGNGGAAADRVRAEGQDSSGTNNANFSTPADGGRGRMQMFVFTDSTPNRDGTADADIIIHELTHGTSNRLHGNASGLGTNMSRGMGEGWGDFYAHALLSEPSDPINGIYATGGWTLLNGFGAIGTTNYYYGIRRFPKAVMAFTGGPLNRPHNPLTFADLNVGCDTSDGAFPAATGPHISTTCDQVHAAGEIWSSALWEVRALMISRLGFAAGNQRALQVVTDGMKLSPLNPTFLDSRDAILAAASAISQTDVGDVWEGFRIRGMGFSAEVLATSPASVVEAFDSPNVTFVDAISYLNVTCSDPSLTPIPGDTLAIQIPITNNTGTSVTNVTATLGGSTTASYGTVASGATVSRVFFYTIPEAAVCGSVLSLPITGSSSIAAMGPTTYDLLVGIAPTLTTNFSNTGLIEIPATPNTSGPANPYPSAVTVSGITDTVLGATFTLNNLNHTWVGDVDILLEGPGGETFVPMSDSFSSSNQTNTVVATLLLTDDGSETMPSSGVPPASGIYKPTNHSSTDTFDAPAPAGPYNHPSPGGAATFASVFGATNANGIWNLWIDDDASGDPGTLDNGWSLGIITAQTPECPACGDPYCVPSVDLAAQDVATTLAVEACEQLTAADFGVLGPGGDVTLTAGEKIIFYNGVSVGDGASLECGTDPSLLPPP